MAKPMYNLMKQTIVYFIEYSIEQGFEQIEKLK